MIVINILLDMT